MKRIFVVTILSAVTFTSCVSKKKYMAALQENEKMEAKLGAINSKVSNYYAKINSLNDENESLNYENDSLNYHQFNINDLAAMSEANKDAMRATLEKVDDSLVAQAETLEDSINLAIAHNLERHINSNGENEDVQVSVDGTVVMINLSDELLFRSGSAHVSRNAYPVLKKLAAVINTEPAMEVLVEGHTDSRTVVKESYLIDNWDLSLRRSAAVVRLLQDKFNVAPTKMIAAGRSSYDPVVKGTSKEAMAKNRRTTITILPNLDKFLALLDVNTQVASTNTKSDEMSRELNTEVAPKNTEVDNSIELEKQSGID